MEIERHNFWLQKKSPSFPTKEQFRQNVGDQTLQWTRKPGLTHFFVQWFAGHCLWRMCIILEKAVKGSLGDGASVSIQKTLYWPNPAISRTEQKANCPQLPACAAVSIEKNLTFFWSCLNGLNPRVTTFFFFFNFQETPEDPAETIMTALFLAVNVRAEGGPEA